VTAAAAAHGYSRAGFYLVTAAFEQAGMSGLLDEKRGRRGAIKLPDQIVEFRQTAPPDRPGAELTVQVADRFGVVTHRGTGPAAMSVRALVSPGNRFWPVGEAAQADYEALRAQVLATGARVSPRPTDRRRASGNCETRGPRGLERCGDLLPDAGSTTALAHCAALARLESGGGEEILLLHR
jgi:hypothetical protein